MADDRDHNVVAFLRRGADGTRLACVINFAGVPHHDYVLGLPLAGRWDEVLNTDARDYRGFGVGNPGRGGGNRPGGTGPARFGTAATGPVRRGVAASGGLTRPRQRSRGVRCPSTPQRWEMGTYERSPAPMYTCRGRPILVSGSEIISRHCAIQPGNRPSANRTVNILVGKPIAL